MVNMKSLLGKLAPQPNQTQTLLGEFYDPRAAAWSAFGGALQGAGAGLASGGKGDWAVGLSAGANEALDNYRNQALLGYKLKQQADNQAYAQQQDSRQWDWREKEAQRDQSNADRTFGLAQQRLAQDQSGGGVEYGLNPVALGDQNGNFVGWGQMSKAGGLFFNGQPVNGANGLQPMSPFATNNLKAAGTASGTQQGGASAALPAAMIDAQATTDKIDSLLANPNLGDAVGYGSMLGDMFTSNNVLDIRRQVNELKGSAFMSAYSALKGGGPITEVEGLQAKQSLADMDTAMKASDPAMFRKALETFKSAVSRGVEKMQAQAGSFAPGSSPIGAVAPPAAKGGGAEEWSIDGNGNPVRVR